MYYSMSEGSRKCPYCSVKNETAVVSRGHRALASLLGLLGYEGSKTTTVRSCKISCLFCTRKYTLIEFTDWDWVKDKLILADSVRSGMTSIFGPSVSETSLLSNITGCALRKDDILDICFKKGRKRACISCVNEGKRYKGVYMREIELGPE